MADVAIIGGGPAGLSAAIYTARADRETLVFDNGGGTTRDVDWMENVYGFPEGVSGTELVEVGREHATKYGAEIVEEEVVRVSQGMSGFEVETNHGEYAADGIILATGASYETPGIRNVDDFEGHGVSYCVECDAYFYRDQTVVVVGSENYAAKEALLLLDYTDDVTILTNGKEFTVDDQFADQIESEGIEVVEENVERVDGDDVLSEVVLEESGTMAVDGLFVALGAAGGGDIADMLGIPMDGDYVQVDEDQRTNVDRVYAAGDLVGGHRQIATSVGEGAEAAINLLEDFRGANYVDYKKVDESEADAGDDAEQESDVTVAPTQ
jgi:thioredoxin reductase (NADPH)